MQGAGPEYSCNLQSRIMKRTAVGDNGIAKTRVKEWGKEMAGEKHYMENP
jgi:hypothetical protein